MSPRGCMKFSIILVAVFCLNSVFSSQAFAGDLEIKISVKPDARVQRPTSSNRSGFKLLVSTVNDGIDIKMDCGNYSDDGKLDVVIFATKYGRDNQGHPELSRYLGSSNGTSNISGKVASEYKGCEDQMNSLRDQINSHSNSTLIVDLVSKLITVRSN